MGTQGIRLSCSRGGGTGGFEGFSSCNVVLPKCSWRAVRAGRGWKDSAVVVKASYRRHSGMNKRTTRKQQP